MGGSNTSFRSKRGRTNVCRSLSYLKNFLIRALSKYGGQDGLAAFRRKVKEAESQRGFLIGKLGEIFLTHVPQTDSPDERRQTLMLALLLNLPI